MEELKKKLSEAHLEEEDQIKNEIEEKARKRSLQQIEEEVKNIEIVMLIIIIFDPVHEMEPIDPRYIFRI